MHPLLRVELDANTPHIDSSPNKSIATNRALIPSFLWSGPDPSVSALASSREQRASPRSRGTLQTLRVGRVLSAWPSSLLQTPFSELFVIVEVLCRAIIFSSRTRDCSHHHTSNVRLADALPALPLSRVRLLAWSLQSTWAFRVTVGKSRRRHNKNIRFNRIC